MDKYLEWHQLTENGLYWKVLKSDTQIYSVVEYDGGTIGVIGAEVWEDLVHNNFQDEYFFVKVEVPNFNVAAPEPATEAEEFDAEIHCKMLTDAIEASGILNSPGISLKTPANEAERFPGFMYHLPRFVNCLLEIYTGLAGEGALIVRLAGNGGWSFVWVGARYHDSDTEDFRHVIERKILNAAFKQATA
jgi:hypothetical protein